MPYEDPDPTDPMTLHGVGIETESDEAMVEMAICFIEEYARLGFDPDRILRMFHTEAYAGPRLALQTLGEERIRALINDEMAIRGHRRSTKDCLKRTSTGIALPVMDADC